MNSLRTLAACALALVLAACVGDDVTPQNTNVAGTWAVTCQPVNEDCPNFSISFDAAGDITNVDIDGHVGAQRGTGTIKDGVLAFKIGFGGVYEFSGMLDGAGRSATGSLTNLDYDGRQRTTQAVATRR